MATIHCNFPATTATSTQVQQGFPMVGFPTYSLPHSSITAIPSYVTGDTFIFKKSAIARSLQWYNIIMLSVSLNSQFSSFFSKSLALGNSDNQTGHYTAIAGVVKLA